MKYTDPTGMMDEVTVVAKIIDNINKSKGDVLDGVISSINEIKTDSYDFSFEGDNIVAQPHSRETAITGLGLKVNELKFTGDSLSVKAGIVRMMIWKKDK